MIRPETFVEELQRLDFGLCSGVPCSYLTPLINTLIRARQFDYVGASNEGDAVAIACGAELGGRRAVVLMQNSGLGNAVSPLTSLTAVFRLPVLVIVTWRGQPDAAPDEPQHALMGRVTGELLEKMEIPWEPMPRDEPALRRVLDRAVTHMQASKTPYALIVRKETFAGDAAGAPPPPRRVRPQLEPCPPPSATLDPDDALRTVQAAVSDGDAVLATTGYTGRALYALSDLPNQFYMVGSMGCVSSLGLGLAKVQPHRRIVVIDGDGAMLMRLGAVATIGHERPPNLVHVLLDNGVHDSTGSQATLSPSVDLPSIARACGYPHIVGASTVEDLRVALRAATSGPSLIHVRTTPRSDRRLPRPTLTPEQVAERFRGWLSAGRG